MTAENTSNITVTPLDFSQDEVLADYHRVLKASASHGRNNPNVWTLDGLRSYFGSLEDPDATKLYGAYLHGKLLGVASAEISDDEGQRNLELNIEVLPDYRRQGIGSAIYLRCADELLSTPYLISGEAYPPFGQAKTWPGHLFAQSLEFSLVHEEEHMQLTREALQDGLGSSPASGLPEGFNLISWQGATPAEYLEEFAQLRTNMEVDVPTGQSVKTPKVWSVQEVRSHDQRVSARGNCQWVSAVQAPDGALAGYTLIYSSSDSTELEQDDTYILRKYRGLGLGLPLKLHNHWQVLEGVSNFSAVTSWVDAENLAMYAVNRALGYQGLELCQMLEKQG